MGDDTLDFLESVRREVKDKKLKKILKVLIDESPAVDLGYMDWYDREDFLDNEYDGIVSETAKKLDKICG